MKKHDEQSDVVQMDITQLDTFLPRNHVWPPEFVQIVIELKNTFAEVYNKTLTEWIEGFDSDANPEQEIAIWRVMAGVYEKSLPLFKNDATTRQEVFKVVLLHGCAVPDEEIKKQVNPEILSLKDIDTIITSFHSKQ